MSPITTRKDDEDMLELDPAPVLKSSQPVVSDSRRRRLRAQGIEPLEIAADDSLDDEDDSAEAGQTAAKGRPTPSRNGTVQRANNPVARAIESVREYVHDVRSELGKVTWLTFPEVRRLSSIVLAVTVTAAIFLGLLSFLFGTLAGAVEQKDTSLVAGIAVIVIIIVVSLGWLLRERLFPGQDFDDRNEPRKGGFRNFRT